MRSGNSCQRCGMSKKKTPTIGDIITLQRGFDITKKEQITGNYPVVSSSGITSYHNRFKAKGPGVVIGRKGTLGTAFYINDDYWPHDTSLWVKDFKGNNEYYIYCLLRSLKLERLDSGSANPTLNRNFVHQIPIRKVDKEYQAQIAHIIQSLDAKIDCNNRINAELEAMVNMFYNYWFVQFDFPDENGKPYKSSGGEMVYNNVLKREIPVGWKNGALDNLGQIVGGSTPSTKAASHFSSNGIPWVTPNDLSNNQGNKFITRGALDVSIEGMKNASLKKYPAGTVLLSSRAPVGYMAIARGEITTNQGFKSFIPNKGYSSEFLYYCIKNMLGTIKRNSSGSTFKEISAGMLKTIKVLLPHPDVSNLFSNEVRAIFRRQDLLEQENLQLTILRDWLLPMLMNGQVTVTDDVDKKSVFPAVTPSENKYDQRVATWRENQALAARGSLDEATLRELFDAMDDDDK